MDAQDIILFNVARMGDVALLKQLIEQKADVNIQDAKGFTPLIIASYKGQLEATQLLPEAHADVNARDFGGNTALMGVCIKGYADIAELLIAHGADLDMQHGNGGTAVMFATLFGRNQKAPAVPTFGKGKPQTYHSSAIPGTHSYSVASQFTGRCSKQRKNQTGF